MTPDVSSMFRKPSSGSFLSRAGEYAAARGLLQEALREVEAQHGPDDRQVGCIACTLAENEVRYWDSRRDWASPSALALLLDSSRTAVRILGARPRRQSERLEYVQALTRWANGCFKAACVCVGHEATAYLDHADEAIDTARRILAGAPPSRALGRALLVGGVTMLVRAHAQLREVTADGQPAQYRPTVRKAADLFMEAEKVLVQAVGEINESSIYTHGNLAELYLHDVHNLPAGIRHFARCCRVGVQLLGPEHPNVSRKLEEFAQLLQALDFQSVQSIATAVRNGDLHDVERVVQFVESRFPDRSIAEWVMATEQRQEPAQAAGLDGEVDE